METPRFTAENCLSGVSEHTQLYNSINVQDANIVVPSRVVVRTYGTVICQEVNGETIRCCVPGGEGEKSFCVNFRTGREGYGV